MTNQWGEVMKNQEGWQISPEFSQCLQRLEKKWFTWPQLTLMAQKCEQQLTKTKQLWNVQIKWDTDSWNYSIEKSWIVKWPQTNENIQKVSDPFNWEERNAWEIKRWADPFAHTESDHSPDRSSVRWAVIKNASVEDSWIPKISNASARAAFDQQPDRPLWGASAIDPNTF